MSVEKNENKPKLLALSYFHPPLEAVATLRNAALFQEFKTIFREVFVLSTSNLRLLPTFKYYKPKGSLILIPTFDFRTIVYFLKKNSTNSQISESKKQSRVAKIFIKLKATFPFAVFLSEGSIVYNIAATVRAVRLIRKNNITHLFTAFYPLSDIYVGFLIKCCIPKIIWVCDFRDLPVDPYFNNTYFPEFQDWILKKILLRAQHLTTVSEGLKDHLLKYNPNVKVVRNGIAAELLDFQKQPFEKFTIGYTGSLYGYDATLNYFAKIIKNLSERKIIYDYNFQILYAGKDADVLKKIFKEEKIDRFIVSVGQVAHAESLKIQRNAQINIIFSYTLPNFFGILTGKFYEYLATKNPILVLIDGVKDAEFEKILADLNAGNVFYTDERIKKTADFVENYFKEWQKNGLIESTFDTEKLRTLDWKTAAQKIFEA